LHKCLHHHYFFAHYQCTSLVTELILLKIHVCVNCSDILILMSSKDILEWSGMLSGIKVVSESLIWFQAASTMNILIKDSAKSLHNVRTTIYPYFKFYKNIFSTFCVFTGSQFMLHLPYFQSICCHNDQNFQLRKKKTCISSRLLSIRI
jgi:hypothetical protein